MSDIHRTNVVESCPFHFLSLCWLKPLIITVVPYRLDSPLVASKRDTLLVPRLSLSLSSFQFKAGIAAHAVSSASLDVCNDVPVPVLAPRLALLHFLALEHFNVCWPGTKVAARLEFFGVELLPIFASEPQGSLDLSITERATGGTVRGRERVAGDHRPVHLKGEAESFIWRVLAQKRCRQICERRRKGVLG
jgi:hypothetical protein